MSAATAAEASPITEILPDLDQVQAHFLALSRPGEVREVRGLGHIPLSGFGGPATASGYFDNAEALVRALQGLGSQHAEGVYITQNPVDPELRARANNRLKRKPMHTTTDADIMHIAHLTADIDPVRKAGISATDTELARALALRDNIIQVTTEELGWPSPVVSAMSGNGAQATWRLDLDATEENVALVKAVLEVFDALFSTAEVSVDTTLSNPSQLIKLCGTVASKGDPLPHRPHRQSHGAFQPEAGTVSEAQLRALIALVPEPAAPSQNGPKGSGRTRHTGGADGYDIPTLLHAAGIDYTERRRGDIQVYRLHCCLSSDAHNDGAAILQFPSGAVSYCCHHNTCAGIGWQDIQHRLGIHTAAPGASSAPGQNGKTPHADAGAGAPEPEWPTLDETAYHGLAGDVVHTIEPHTEGDPIALLVNFLVDFGSAVGPSPHARVGATKHRGNEFATFVGETARARKGTASNEVERIVTAADPDFKPRIVGGLSSGEGLIFAVRDPIWKPNKDGEMKLTDPGVDDKRLLVIEPEFSSVLRVAGRDGNTVSEVLRRAWDGNDLRTLTRSSPLVATTPHISLVGHITKPELLRELSEIYQANGFANRFLFICVRRSKELPHGGALADTEVFALARRVRDTLNLARHRTMLRRDEETDRVWEVVYSALTAERPGMIGAITARAEAHVLRLSLLYALLDGAEAICRPHLEAALALWQYAEDSARFIFGDASGDPVADHILAALRSNGAMTQTQISELFSRNQRAGRLEHALAALLEAGKVHTWRGESKGGRAPIWWEAV